MFPGDGPVIPVCGVVPRETLEVGCCDGWIESHRPFFFNYHI